MGTPRLIVAGIGPGSACDITPAVIQAVKESDVVIGYKYYFQFQFVWFLSALSYIHTDS